MAEYQRFISYMYVYQNGMKKNSVGYVRLETRNDQLRATVHLQVPGNGESILPTYFIMWKDGEMELVFLGDSIAKGQMIDGRMMTKIYDINQSGYRFDQMGGLITLVDGQLFYATEWCDISIEWNQVLKALRKRDAKAHQPEEVRVEQNNNPNISSEKLKEENELFEKIVEQRDTTIEEKEEKEQGNEDNKEKLEDRSNVGVALVQKPSKNIAQQNEPIENVNTEDKENDEGNVELSSGQNSGQNTSIQEQRIQEEENQAALVEEESKQENKQTTQQMVKQTERKETKQLEAEESSRLNPDESEESKEALSEKLMASDVAEVLEEYIPRDLEVGCEDGNTVADCFREYEKEDISSDEPEIAQEIFHNCKRMYPFEDHEVLVCAKLDLQDINRFPLHVRSVVSNSFLLHGFYSYHHIIFLKLREQGEEKYFLGVPGIFQHRERNMARMFGFEYFKGIKNKELRPGEFGYWFIHIDI